MKLLIQGTKRFEVDVILLVFAIFWFEKNRQFLKRNV